MKGKKVKSLEALKVCQPMDFEDNNLITFLTYRFQHYLINIFSFFHAHINDVYSKFKSIEVM